MFLWEDAADLGFLSQRNIGLPQARDAKTPDIDQGFGTRPDS